MVRLFRRMDGVDARCVRLHRLPAHYGADRAGVWRSDHRSDRGLLGHPGNAARWCDSLRLVGRPFGTPGTADDFDPLDQDHLPGIGIAANEIDEYPADVGEGPAFQRPSIDPVKR